MSNDSQIGKYVVVATTSRPWSIVAGTMISRTGGTVRLKDARMIVYYGVGTRGLLGIAARGPVDGRVASAVEEAVVRKVEHVLLCSDTARKAIEAEPWV